MVALQVQKVELNPHHLMVSVPGPVSKGSRTFHASIDRHRAFMKGSSFEIASLHCDLICDGRYCVCQRILTICIQEARVLVPKL